MVCKYHIIFIHLSAGEHLGCFYFLKIINNTVIDHCVQNLFQHTFLFLLVDI